jgi:flagellar basal body rod protein FlgG
MESLELLANNVANAATGGYKADREFYGLYAAESGTESTMPLIERPWIDFSQGLIHSTGNPLDVAISGRGFFAVNGPNGPLYTRNGNFRLGPGGQLVTAADGYAVRGQGGNPIVLQSGRAIDIGSDGVIQQEGTIAGKLELVEFKSSDAIDKQGNNYFRATDPQAAAAASGVVEQGKLEASNTGSAESAVRLVSVMRQFEMLQKAVNLGGEMNRSAIEQVARVGN